MKNVRKNGSDQPIMYAEYPLGEYDPSWHVYGFDSKAVMDMNTVRRGMGRGALLETYEEGGDHDTDATLEIVKDRYVVFAKAGLYHGLYDIFCQRPIVNVVDPWHEALSTWRSTTTNPAWPRYYLNWKLTHLDKPIRHILSKNENRCDG